MDEIVKKQRVTVGLVKRVKQANYILNAKKSENIIDKPVLLCLGGNKIIEPKDAGVVARIVDGFVGKIDEPYDIISVAYGEEYMFNIDANSKYLCDTLFLPLITNENGERLPLADAMKRMRRMNVFTHCAGNFRFDGIIRELKKAMSKLGYIKQEKELILGQICVVGYTPWAMIKDDHIKKLYIQSIEDVVSPKLAENLYRIQRENFPRSKVEVSHPDMIAGDREVKVRFCDRIYRLALENKIISFFVKKLNTLCYISKSQSKDYSNNDHELKCLIRDLKFALKSNSSEVADAVSLLISEILLASLSNSISNEHKKSGYEEALSISSIKDICDSLVKIRLRDESIKY